MADQWLNIYHQNLSDREISNPAAATAAASSATTQSPAGPSLSPDGRVAKPVRKRSRASRRTPTTLLNTDAANFRAMVQQFTGGPTSNANVSNFTFGFPGSSHQPPVYDPAATAYHLQAQQQAFQYQTQQPPPFMFSLGNSPASEVLFQGSNNVADYMGLLDGPSPPPPPPTHHHPRPS